MSYITHLTCTNCKATYEEGSHMTCPACGIDDGILEVHFDLDRARSELTRDALALRPRNHWRYRELLPIEPGVTPLPREIGWTPMIEAPRLAATLGIRRLRLKDDSRSASASFKDRASAVAVTRALLQGSTQIACASTGNAASSLAHCAAAVGIQANIFVGERIPAGKLVQLLAYGARVFKVRGTYDQAWRLCMEACEEFKWYNRNCAINPYLVEGKKTGGMEIAEQCIDDPPEWVSASVGDGCSIAGIDKGLRQMHAIGLLSSRPRMLGVQAAGVAAVAKAYHTGRIDITPDGDTYADSINCPVPRNWRKAVNAVRDSGGAFVTVSDDQIREAVRQTGALAGCFAEPAAAAAIAAIVQARHENLIDHTADVVAVISGNGLKDTQGAQTAVGEPFFIEPNLQGIKEIVSEDRE